MKALILAAGLGSRLRPYTDHIPKPLFPVSGRPLIDRLIRQLVSAGCTAVAVNTHHLHGQIDTFLSTQSYGVEVFTRHEPVLLGTGGAIKNLSDFWDDQPFFVVNSDILTDIDFGAVYEFHNRHNAPATLVLTDSPELNSVSVSTDETIKNFHPAKEIKTSPDLVTYTFTGIQVLDPNILPLIPEKTVFSSIDTYRELIDLGLPPRAYMALSNRWADVGTPDRYQTTVRDLLAQEALREAFGNTPSLPVEWIHLDGDGSDRAWYRLRSGDASLIAVDHGIKTGEKKGETDSFVSIGNHLNNLGVPVPTIYGYDLFSGWVIMEDVGDIHLQTIVQQKNTPEFTRALYRKVLDVLVRFSTEGLGGFDSAWTCQTATYDAPLILERECAYFVDSFLRGYLGLNVDGRDFEPAFGQLARGALENAVTGLMHRDFQSRNILIYNGEPRIIDFQGARLGPVQYDMASLLIDPYVELSPSLQDELFDYALKSLLTKRDFDPEGFRKCFNYCKVTRNLQILGAFGFLTREKGKQQFNRYIRPALQRLKQNLGQLDSPEISKLRIFVEEIQLGDTDEKK